jgi:hypothetical protein
VVDDAVRRVAVVDVELSRLPRVRSRTGSRGRSKRRREDGGAKGKPPGTKTATRRGSRKRGSMSKLMQSGADGRDGPEFARTPRGRWHALVLPIPDVRGRVHHQALSSEGSAEKASTAVTGTQW